MTWQKDSLLSKHGGSPLGIVRSSIGRESGRIRDQEIELVCPEPFQLQAQLSHSGRRPAIDALSARLAVDHQPHLGQHAEML